MKTAAALIALTFFFSFAVLAGKGEKTAAAASLIAGFLVGVTLAQVPPRAEREKARQRQQAAQDPNNFTRIY